MTFLKIIPTNCFKFCAAADTNGNLRTIRVFESQKEARAFVARENLKTAREA